VVNASKPKRCGTDGRLTTAEIERSGAQLLERGKKLGGSLDGQAIRQVREVAIARHKDGALGRGERNEVVVPRVGRADGRRSRGIRRENGRARVTLVTGTPVDDLWLDLERAPGARLASMSGITIGEAAQRTGLSVDTLRYYERAGLIDPVRRARNGRRYDEIDLLWLAFLRRLRATGMPIAQMRRFARLRYAGDTTAGERRDLLEEHARFVRDRLAELSESLEIVERKITHYRRLEEASRSKPTMTPRAPRPRRASTDQAATAEGTR